MQRSGKSAEPSMEEILASIRKIISDEPSTDTPSEAQKSAAEPTPAPRAATGPSVSAPADPDDDLADILGQPTQAEPSSPAAAVSANPFRKTPAAPAPSVAERPAPAEQPTFTRSPFPPKSSRDTGAAETPAEATRTNPFGLPPQAKMRQARTEDVPPVPQAPAENDTARTGTDSPFAGRLADRLRSVRPEPAETKPASSEAGPFGRRPAPPPSETPDDKPAASSTADNEEPNRAAELAALAASAELRSPNQVEQNTAKDTLAPEPASAGEAASASPKPVTVQPSPEPTAQKPAAAAQPATKPAADKPASPKADEYPTRPKPAEQAPGGQPAAERPAPTARPATEKPEAADLGTPAPSQKTFEAVGSALALLAATPSTEASVDKPVAEAKADRPDTTKAAPEAATSRTLEDAVADLLRPMLRDWLDANLPRIVEKALREELAKRDVSAAKPDEPRV